MTVLHRLALYDAWQRDLVARIARAKLIFELVDVDIDIDALKAEFALLKRTKTILDWLEKHDATQEECVS